MAAAKMHFEVGNSGKTWCGKPFDGRTGWSHDLETCQKCSDHKAAAKEKFWAEKAKKEDKK